MARMQMTDALMKTKVLHEMTDSLKRVSGLLKSEGYDVRHALNGHEALVAYHALPDIALVLLDLNMPVKGGWDTFERLMAINPLLPVIIITARPDQQSLAAAAGAGALMEKPLEIRCCSKPCKAPWPNRQDAPRPAHGQESGVGEQWSRKACEIYSHLAARFRGHSGHGLQKG